MAKQLSFADVMTFAASEFHAARHLTIRFMDMNDEAPEIDAGWAAGVLFGLHFALTYPQLSAKLNRALFEFDSSANTGVDMLANTLSARYFPPVVATEDDLLKKWESMRDKYNSGK